MWDRYDSSGRTDDKFADAEEMGWDAYFEQMFERIDGKMLDADKAKYQGKSVVLDNLTATILHPLLTKM